MALSRIFLWMALGSLVGLAVLLVAENLLPVLGLRGERLSASLGVLLALGLAGAACAAARHRGRFPRLMTSGLITGVLAAVSWIWLFIYSPYFSLSIAVTVWLVPLTAWTCLMVYLSAIAARRAEPKLITRLRRASIATAAGFAASLTVMSLGARILPPEPPWQHVYYRFVDFWYGLGGVLGSLTFLLFLVVSLASIVPHLKSRGVPDEQRVDVRIVCPRCRLGQSIRSDGDVCRRCRLRISVLTA